LQIKRMRNDQKGQQNDAKLLENDPVFHCQQCLERVYRFARPREPRELCQGHSGPLECTRQTHSQQKLSRDWLWE
jgi:hypothetical protein